VLIHKDLVLTEVLLDGEHIETTPHHPFYTQEKGWVYAGELKIGMHIRKADGTYGLVWWAWNVEREQVMYNLTVDTAHTYFVGQGQWLVHNTGAGPCPIGTNGTKFTSKTLWEGEPGRLDVENPAPGVRDGQIHFQEWGNNAGKWIYDLEGKMFPGAPRWLDKLLDSGTLDKAIQKGLRFLGE
jgi:hypothetical protein